MATVCNEIHLNDIGTIFELLLKDCGIVADVSAATSITINFRKPDATTLTKTGVFKTDGTDGIIQYTTISGDINQIGTWKIQGIVVLPSGTFSSSLGTFKVLANII